jgi:ubiquinone/menaquinone biosynthesis C-methylase UbiE
LEIVGIDLNDRMLERARHRATRLGHPIDLVQMDAEELDFPTDSFYTAVATFVFPSTCVQGRCAQCLIQYVVCKSLGG